MGGIIEERKQISNLEFKCCLSIQGFTVFQKKKEQITESQIKTCSNSPEFNTEFKIREFERTESNPKEF